jgi:hypothetical protein
VILQPARLALASVFLVSAAAKLADRPSSVTLPKHIANA